MKFHSGTPSGTVVPSLEMANFSSITKRGEVNQGWILYGKEDQLTKKEV